MDIWVQLVVFASALVTLAGEILKFVRDTRGEGAFQQAPSALLASAWTASTPGSLAATSDPSA